MKKEVTTTVDMCDVCEKYPVRYHCQGCPKVVCHNCVRDFTEFQRRVKSASLNTINFCSECMKDDIPLVSQLQRIRELSREWWSLVEKYDKLAEEAEEGVGDGYYD